MLALDLPKPSAAERLQTTVIAWVDWLRHSQSVTLRTESIWVSQCQQLLANLQTSGQSVTQLRSKARLNATNATNDTSMALALAAMAMKQTVGLTPRAGQWITAKAMLRGRLAQMNTGEGKTAAAFIAAASAALLGRQVHLVTANQYLAQRDWDTFKGAFELLGVSSAVLIPSLSVDEKRTVYQSNIVYCTASELIFDYLRDRLPHAPQAQALVTSLDMAIVDEADFVLIDEASTPFVLATQDRPTYLETDLWRRSVALAKLLKSPTHFTVAKDQSKQCHLTEAGKVLLTTWHAKMKVQDQSSQSLLSLANSRLREECVSTALRALHCYQNHREYLIQNQEIAIVDPQSGRVAQGRRWAKGLHQCIEIKESLNPSSEQKNQVQLSFQRFFPRYKTLSGMSGTLTEARAELMRTYKLRIDVVAPDNPSRLVLSKPALFKSRQQQYQRLLELVQVAVKKQRPVLIGTDSIQDTTAVIDWLAQNKIDAVRLDATNDENEQRIIAQAGQLGSICVATSMAGRGTDIALADSAKALGGLLVISTQNNNSARIDRQLAGRSGRRGAPGQFIHLLCAQDGLARTAKRSLTGLALHWLYKLTHTQSTASRLIRCGQKHLERQASLQRRQLLAQDRQIERQAAFGGTRV